MFSVQAQLVSLLFFLPRSGRVSQSCGLPHLIECPRRRVFHSSISWYIRRFLFIVNGYLLFCGLCVALSAVRRVGLCSSPALFLLHYNFYLADEDVMQQSVPLCCFDFIKKCCGYFPNKSHTFCMQLFVCFSVFLYFVFRISLTMRRKAASAAEIFAVKSHLHNAAPEIVISRFAVCAFCVFYYYSAMNCTFKRCLWLGVFGVFVYYCIVHEIYLYANWKCKWAERQTISVSPFFTCDSDRTTTSRLYLILF